MTFNDWLCISGNFKKKEFVPYHYSMDFTLMLFMDKLRDYLDCPIIVHEGFAIDGHVKNSYHYKGEAIDFHIKGMKFSKAWRILNRVVYFGGLGAYPYWNNPGYHIDIGKFRRWYRNKNGVYVYHKPIIVSAMSLRF